MLTLFDPAGESEERYQDVQNDNFNNQSSFGHEALAGAASFGAFKIFEDRQRKEGTPLPSPPSLPHTRA